MKKINNINEILNEDISYDITVLTEGLNEKEYDLIIECLENSNFDSNTNTFEDIEEIDEEYRTLKEFILDHLYSIEQDIENGYNNDYKIEYIQNLIKKYS